MHGSGAASGSVTAVSSVTKLVISRDLQLAPEEFLPRLFCCLVKDLICLRVEKEICLGHGGWTSILGERCTYHIMADTDLR